MITTIVEFALPAPMSAQQAEAVFLSTAPKYLGMAGLIRKYYFVSPDGSKAGGIYLWENLEAAEALYTENWKDFVRGKYGSEPRITYLETPVVVDNQSNRIVSLSSPG